MYSNDQGSKLGNIRVSPIIKIWKYGNYNFLISKVDGQILCVIPRETPEFDQASRIFPLRSPVFSSSKGKREKREIEREIKYLITKIPYASQVNADLN